MNHSIYSADRATHLKIVVVALIAGIAVAGLGISARLSTDDGYMQSDSSAGHEAGDAAETKEV
jgi:hypothetical protein